MSSVKPYQRKPGLKDPAADQFDQLSKVSLLDGRELDVAFEASILLVTRHGLGRAFRGAIVVGQSDISQRISSATPQAVQLAGFDPTTHIALYCSAATSMTVRLWVF